MDEGVVGFAISIVVVCCGGLFGDEGEFIVCALGSVHAEYGDLLGSDYK